MSKTTEMLRARAREIKGEIAPLQAELREIEQALEAIEGGKPQPTTKMGKPISKATVVRQVEFLLQQHPKGLKNPEMRKLLLSQCDREITGRNLSWHLSKMRREGRVVNNNSVWSLPKRNETPPNAKPGGVSEVTGEGGASPNEGRTLV